MKSSMVCYKRLLVSGIILTISLAWCQNFDRQANGPRPLFNGKNLDGWVAVDSKLEQWTMENGVLNTGGQGGGWIRTAGEYSDFEISLDFKVSPGSNSGLFLRAPEKGDPAYTGMEIQVLDDHAPRYAKLKPYQYTGSIYAVQPPSERRLVLWGDADAGVRNSNLDPIIGQHAGSQRDRAALLCELDRV